MAALTPIDGREWKLWEAALEQFPRTSLNMDAVREYVGRVAANKNIELPSSDMQTCLECALAVTFAIRYNQRITHAEVDRFSRALRNYQNLRQRAADRAVHPSAVDPLGILGVNPHITMRPPLVGRMQEVRIEPIEEARAIRPPSDYSLEELLRLDRIEASAVAEEIDESDHMRYYGQLLTLWERQGARRKPPIMRRLEALLGSRLDTFDEIRPPIQKSKKRKDGKDAAPPVPKNIPPPPARKLKF